MQWSVAFAVLYFIESSNGKLLVGDDGDSIGPYHITKQYVDEANRIAGCIIYDYEDRNDYLVSMLMILRTTKYWLAEKNLPLTYENVFRLHNAGPSEMFSEKGDRYWARCKEYMDKLANTEAKEREG